MTFSYLSTAPGSSDITYMRLRLGDNSSSSVMFQDEELEAFLEQEGSLQEATAVAAESAAAKFAQQADKTVGRLSISASKKADAFLALAKRLRSVGNAHVGPYVGGISVSDKEAQEADTDRVPPGAYLGQYDMPGQTLDETFGGTQ